MGVEDAIKGLLNYGELNSELETIRQEYSLTNSGQQQFYNAYAHAWVSAAIAYDTLSIVSEVAGRTREYKSAFEEATGANQYPTWKGAMLDGNRDLYNNNIGIQIAEFVGNYNLPRDTLKTLVLDALNNGELITQLDDNRLDLDDNRLDSMNPVFLEPASGSFGTWSGSNIQSPSDVLATLFPDIPKKLIEEKFNDAKDAFIDGNAAAQGALPFMISAAVLANLSESELFSDLKVLQEYWQQNGNNLPDPPVVPPTTTTPPPDDGPSHGRPDRGDDDDTPAVVVAPVEPDPVDPTAPTPGTSWVDPNTGRTNVQGDPVTGAGGHGIQAPVILGLDGDGVEVAFGEDIYFDLDDDGFLVIDKLANDVRDTDGSDGWGDGVIDQSNELVLSSLGLEGARRGGLASGVVDQGRGFGERF